MEYGKRKRKLKEENSVKRVKTIVNAIPIKFEPGRSIKEEVPESHTNVPKKKAKKSLLKKSASTNNISSETTPENKIPEEHENLSESESNHEEISIECVIREKHPNYINEPYITKKEVEDELLEHATRTSKLPHEIVKNVMNLFAEDYTIPFIARYRKEKIGELSPDDLRMLKNHLKIAKMVQTRRAFIIKQLAKAKQLTNDLFTSLKSADTLESLDFIYSPYKSVRKNKVAEAINSGLQATAVNILNGKGEIKLESLIKPSTPGLSDIPTIRESLEILICHMISNDPEVLSELKRLKFHKGIVLKSDLKKRVVVDKSKETYERYHSFCKPWFNVAPHSFLAIERGVSRGVLKSKVELLSVVRDRIIKFVKLKWMPQGLMYSLRREILTKAIELTHKKHIEPFMRKLINIDLKEKAEKASLATFATNLKWLLLTPPMRGITVLAIDPGFAHGCKISVVSPIGRVLHIDTCYITTQREEGIQAKLLETIRHHRVNLIAIGNGKGSSLVQNFINKLLDDFFPNKEVTWTVVNEEGVSIYSCCNEAQEEFPGMNVNHISSISLARRVQDPLSEYVKVEPRHLGIGMYQHDMSEKKLNLELEEVVSECVSAVGVDLNIASTSLLRYIAGLTQKKAKAIVEWRDFNGCFLNREQIKKVKGIGPKAFQQCAGFLRIMPTTISSVCPEEMNYLDQTEIHPELYPATKM